MIIISSLFFVVVEKMVNNDKIIIRIIKPNKKRAFDYVLAKEKERIMIWIYLVLFVLHEIASLSSFSVYQFYSNVYLTNVIIN